MSSRRSSRQSANSSTSSRSAIQPSVRRGLESLTMGNESYIATLLSVNVGTSPCSSEKLADDLEECMKVNNLSAEMILAQFFDKSVLSKYSESTLKKSGKGSASTLAARIATAWAKPTFAAGIVDSSSSSTATKRNREKDDGDSGDKLGSTKKRQQVETSEIQEGDDDVEDWRKPLVFLKGRLQHHEDQNTSSLRWEGSWASDLAEHGLPPTNVFEETQSTSLFDLVGKTVPVNTDQNKHHPFATLFGTTGTFKGTYLLDQGDGQGAKKFRDLTHRFAFATKPYRVSPSSSAATGTCVSDDRLLVAACGTTEFGNFVSAGFARVAIGSKSENSSSCSEHSDIEMVLARRYIDENDMRQSWLKDAKLVVHACLEHVLPSCDHEDNDKTLWGNCLPRRL